MLTRAKSKAQTERKIPSLPAAIIVFVGMIALFLLVPPHHGQDGYMAAINDKHRLLASVTGQKIVLVGGSNLTFGSDSSALKKQTGLPVVNMGLHAGVGLRFMLDDIKPDLRKNDIVVIVPEYEQFNGFSEGRAQQCIQLLEVYPKAMGTIFDYRRAEMLTKEGPALLKKKALWYKSLLAGCVRNPKRAREYAYLRMQELKPQRPYARSSYNENGDVVAHLRLQSPGIARQDIAVSEKPDANSVVILNEFYSFAQNKGIKAFLCFPCIPRSRFESRKKTIDMLYANLKKRLDIPIISKPDQFVLPDLCFFDTCYHLTKNGIDSRMPVLAQDLNRALKQYTASSNSQVYAVH